MPSFEATFGNRHVVIIVNGQNPATAGMCVVEEGGREVRQLANRDGQVIELAATTQQDVLARAKRYLERRFGAEGPAPATPATVLSRTVLEPPLAE